MSTRQVIFDLPRTIAGLRKTAGRLTPFVFALLALSVAAAATNHPTPAPTTPVLTPGAELTFDVATTTAAPTTDAPNTVRMLVTAYCPCKKCCGPNACGITASGRPVTFNDGQFVAADTTLLPFGSQVIVPGYAANAPVPVIDRGGAIIGNHLDVFFPTHEQALEWGRRWVTVTILSH